MTTPESSPSLTRDLALLEGSVGAYMTSDALLRVSGDDRLTWLQGQLTRDLRGLTAGATAYGLLLHANGKVLADLDVLCRRDDVLLVCARDVAAEVQAQLERYIMMEDVELEALSGSVLAMQGPASVALLDPLRDELGADGVFPVDRLGLGGLLVLGHAEEPAAALPEAVRSAGGDWVSEEAVTLARLRAGRPLLGPDFGPSVLPQVAGLGRRALSFDKGCYRGQEPVVMLEHRGSPPKRLVRLRFDAASAPVAGTTVRGSDDAALGAITSAARGPDGVVYALGTLKRGAELSDVVSVGDDALRLPASALGFAE